MGRATNGQLRTIRVADVTISIPEYLSIVSVRITTESRQIVVHFNDENQTQPKEGSK